MTKEVLISISGLQFAEEMDQEPVEVITIGDYYRKNGKHYLIYDEVMEGFSETTKNIIKISDSCVDITKRGVSNTHMMFEKDKKNVTYYYTPYGSILIGVDTKKIMIRETEHTLYILIDYALEVNYAHMADCKIEVNVKSKNAGDFKI